MPKFGTPHRVRPHDGNQSSRKTPSATVQIPDCPSPLRALPVRGKGFNCWQLLQLSKRKGRLIGRPFPSSKKLVSQSSPGSKLLRMQMSLPDMGIEAANCFRTISSRIKSLFRSRNAWWCGGLSTARIPDALLAYCRRLSKFGKRQPNG